MAEDDRDAAARRARALILVIEDDPRFAAILRDLARELGFQCVVAHTADEGAGRWRASYRPSAIVLDMNLPDHSGLACSTSSSATRSTRHIPVHVVSVADYTQRGAGAGRGRLRAEAGQARSSWSTRLRKLESKLAQSLRRVLVVEDDERQRESIRAAAGERRRRDRRRSATAAEALAAAAATTFDCMVMDLTLPDLQRLRAAGEDGGSRRRARSRRSSSTPAAR